MASMCSAAPAEHGEVGQAGAGELVHGRAADHLHQRRRVDPHQHCTARTRFNM